MFYAYCNSVSNPYLVYKWFFWVKIVISRQLLFLSKIYLPKYVCYCIFTYRFSLVLQHWLYPNSLYCSTHFLPYCRVKWIARFIWRQAGTFMSRIAKLTFTSFAYKFGGIWHFSFCSFTAANMVLFVASTILIGQACYFHN